MAAAEPNTSSRDSKIPDLRFQNRYITVMTISYSTRLESSLVKITPPFSPYGTLQSNYLLLSCTTTIRST